MEILLSPWFWLLLGILGLLFVLTVLVLLVAFVVWVLVKIGLVKAALAVAVFFGKHLLTEAMLDAVKRLILGRSQRPPPLPPPRIPPRIP